MAEICRKIEALAEHPGYTPIQRAFLEMLAEELMRISLAQKASDLIQSQVQGAFGFAEQYLASLTPSILGQIHEQPDPSRSG